MDASMCVSMFVCFRLYKCIGKSIHRYIHTYECTHECIAGLGILTLAILTDSTKKEKYTSSRSGTRSCVVGACLPPNCFVHGLYSNLRFECLM